MKKDDELIQIFIEEAEDILDAIYSHLEKWRTDSQQLEFLAPILRELHTLKGSARMVGLTAFSEYVHCLEQLIQRIHDGVLTRTDNVILEIQLAFDFMHEYVESLAEEQLPEDAQIPIAALKQLLDLNSNVSEEHHKSFFVQEANLLNKELWNTILKLEATPSDAKVLGELEKTLSNLVELTQRFDIKNLEIACKAMYDFIGRMKGFSVDENQFSIEVLYDFHDFLQRSLDKLLTNEVVELPNHLFNKIASLFPTVEPEKTENLDVSINQAKEDLSKNVISTDVIRIKSDVISNFSKLAGQINITRSHLEQQLKDVNDSLSDMTKEIKLVQEQMRYLQVKTDASIRMYQTVFSDKSNEEFDILELDRYSFLQQSTRLMVDKLNQIQEINMTVNNSIRSAEALLVEQGRAARSLEQGITHTHLTSIENLVPRLKRIVRQVSAELNKEVEFECIKAQGEVDRKILERLIPSLEHMVRNAIDHGIEPSLVRVKQGKSESGKITMSLFQQGNEIVIQLRDDGQGIDVKKVQQKAEEKKIWDPKQPMSKSDAIQIISLPGFSTKDVVTPISGRGLGIDVVNVEVNKLGGTLSIDTQKNKGTQFTIRLPFSLSLNQALIFISNTSHYALPLAQLAGITRLPATEITAKLNGGNIITYANKRYKLFYLAECLSDDKWNAQKNKKLILPIIFLNSDTDNIGFVVDDLIGSREIMIKPIGLQLQFVKEISGVSLLGNGQIVLILNAQYIMQIALGMEHKGDKNDGDIVFPQQKLIFNKRKILVVDDSTTVRQVTSRLLVRNQYESITAKDGIEALNLMETTLPDCVLLDIEMPQMDGFEVIKRMRENNKFKDIPIIMITSRAGDKHRVRAMGMGANAYLTKPFREEELLSLIQQFVRQSKNPNA